MGIRSARMVRQNSLSQRKISVYGAYSKRFWIRPIHSFCAFHEPFAKRSPHLQVAQRNANGSCYAGFLPQKLPKTVLLRTAAHDFLPNLRVTHKIISRSSRGPATALCHLKVGGAFHEPFVKRTKKWMGLIQKRFE